MAMTRVDVNLTTWAKSNNNFRLLGKLIRQAADAHAGNTLYHVQCYIHLRDCACASNRLTSTGSVPPQFDPIATAQIVALVDDSDSVFKLPKHVNGWIFSGQENLHFQQDKGCIMNHQSWWFPAWSRCCPTTNESSSDLGCLQKHELFSGVFSPNCLASPMPEELRSFINIIIQGTSILCWSK